LLKARSDSEKEIDEDRDRLLALGLGDHNKIMARYEQHKKTLAQEQIEHDRLKQTLGLDALEDRLDAAIEVEIEAEKALIKCGFDTPISIVAGLHRFAIMSLANDLGEWPAVSCAPWSSRC